MSETNITFRASKEEKRRLNVLAKMDGRDMTKQILFWINQNYDLAFPAPKAPESGAAVANE